MDIEYLRKHMRYDLGSTAAFETVKGFCSGGIANSSMGGVFFEPLNGAPEVSEGEELSITLDDIFSEKKCSFNAKVVRASGEGVAFKFTYPLSIGQESFLLNWFTMMGLPGIDTEH